MRLSIFILSQIICNQANMFLQIRVAIPATRGSPYRSASKRLAPNTASHTSYYKTAQITNACNRLFCITPMIFITESTFSDAWPDLQRPPYGYSYDALKSIIDLPACLHRHFIAVTGLNKCVPIGILRFSLGKSHFKSYNLHIKIQKVLIFI